MFIIDTNILVSEILTEYEKDLLTQKYRVFFQDIPLIKRVIPDFILSEFELLLTQVIPSRYKSRMQETEKKELRIVTTLYIERIVDDYTLISPSPLTIKKAFELYRRFQNNHYISFTDSLLLATAQDNAYTLITKDERLNARAKELNIAFFEIKK